MSQHATLLDAFQAASGLAQQGMEIWSREKKYELDSQLFLDNADLGKVENNIVSQLEKYRNDPAGYEDYAAREIDLWEERAVASGNGSKYYLEQVARMKAGAAAQVKAQTFRARVQHEQDRSKADHALVMSTIFNEADPEQIKSQGLWEAKRAKDGGVTSETGMVNEINQVMTEALKKSVAIPAAITARPEVWNERVDRLKDDPDFAIIDNRDKYINDSKESYLEAFQEQNFRAFEPVQNAFIAFWNQGTPASRQAAKQLVNEYQGTLLEALNPDNSDYSRERKSQMSHWLNLPDGSGAGGDSTSAMRAIESIYTLYRYGGMTQDEDGGMRAVTSRDVVSAIFAHPEASGVRTEAILDSLLKEAGIRAGYEAVFSGYLDKWHAYVEKNKNSENAAFYQQQGTAGFMAAMDYAGKNAAPEEVQKVLWKSLGAMGAKDWDWNKAGAVIARGFLTQNTSGERDYLDVKELMQSRELDPYYYQHPVTDKYAEGLTGLGAAINEAGKYERELLKKQGYDIKKGWHPEEEIAGVAGADISADWIYENRQGEKIRVITRNQEILAQRLEKQDDGSMRWVDDKQLKPSPAQEAAASAAAAAQREQYERQANMKKAIEGLKVIPNLRMRGDTIRDDIMRGTYTIDDLVEAGYSRDELMDMGFRVPEKRASPVEQRRELEATLDRFRSPGAPRIDLGQYGRK
ncbi:MAG: hypothetical protein LBL20_02040 [Treponema sp.]|jgi:hypothetical protein|nr:hypothetical protein [Treponema sp.]